MAQDTDIFPGLSSSAALAVLVDELNVVAMLDQAVEERGGHSQLFLYIIRSD
jgi:hypothetical protein